MAEPKTELSVIDAGMALVPRSMAEIATFADRIAKSDFIPKAFKDKPGDIMAAVMMGLEVGLKPMQALQSIAVINGTPSIWGKGARALLMASGSVENIIETDPGEVKKTLKARCIIKRKGIANPFVGEFSKDDAERANLWGKGTYQSYPAEMLAWKAFHRAAAAGFSDVLKGLVLAEEAQDYDVETTGRVIAEAPPTPPPMPSQATATAEVTASTAAATQDTDANAVITSEQVAQFWTNYRRKRGKDDTFARELISRFGYKSTKDIRATDYPKIMQVLIEGKLPETPAAEVATTASEAESSESELIEF